jgi:hypothetical protein
MIIQSNTAFSALPGVAFVAWSIDDVDRELDGLAG